MLSQTYILVNDIYVGQRIEKKVTFRKEILSELFFFTTNHIHYKVMFKKIVFINKK